jgi:GTP-binding protein
VPGYGYARVSKTERAAWGKMIETYLTNREQLKAVVLIVDVRHKPTQDDIMMYDFLKHFGLSVIIIATKADKIPKGNWQKHLKIVKETLELEEGDEMILFSSETAQGKDTAWNAIKSFL